MSARSHFIFWSAALAVLVLFVFAFKTVLLPFVLGFAIAYLLNPLIGKLGDAGVGRGPAALLILFVFFVLALGFLALVLPPAYEQMLQLADDLPGYIDEVWALLKPLSDRLQIMAGDGGAADFQALLREHISGAVNVGRQLAEGVVAGGQAFMNIVSLAVFTPIVAYFVMKEWVNISTWVKDLMPRDQKNTITDLLKQIDQKLSGFIRGQISVAFILGVVYAVALSVAGLKYGFLIGLLSGALSIIPMVGSAVGLIVGVLVAWFQSGDWIFVLIIAGIFLAGQFVEGNFLTPKLVGKSVGMHPLWVFFALLAGGALFGILGMFLAVPAAAVIGVLAAFGIKRYKASSYYKGRKKPGSAKEKKNAA